MVLAFTPSWHTLLGWTKNCYYDLDLTEGEYTEVKLSFFVVLLYNNYVSYCILPIRKYSRESLPYKTNVNDEVLNAKNTRLSSQKEELIGRSGTEIVTL
jgi:hypothetical protein